MKEKFRGGQLKFGLSKKLITLGVVVVLFSVVSVVYAGPLSYPLMNRYEYSWFDHSTPEYSEDRDPIKMTRYDGQEFYNGSSCTPHVDCYNGHDGIDYPVPIGTPVYAAADGVVKK